MTIRKRLILSYLAMLLVPFILIILTGGVLRYLSAAMDGSTLGPFSNSRNSHFPMSDNDVLTQFNEVIINSPSLLFSNDYMSNLETDLNLPGAFAVVQQENIMYKSSWISSSAVMKAISNQNVITGNNRFRKHMEPEILFRWEFAVPDQQNGVLYYLIGPEQVFSQYFLGGLFFVLAVAMVLIITNGTLTYMVSRSIILPLKELEKAAIKIRDGDLDNQITCKADDEMGDVFSSFNEMRERLKDSLEKQISYEDNRKELIASISH
ncbi:MAG: HAMP domain-containing protein, partial [Spirochaetales bacterium]|nr:HAMP domain-containing protein [Spirochaetales bacterium]